MPATVAPTLTGSDADAASTPCGQVPLPRLRSTCHCERMRSYEIVGDIHGAVTNLLCEAGVSSVVPSSPEDHSLDE